MAESATELSLLNPLPWALAHYERTFRAVVRAPLTSLSGAGIETQGGCTSLRRRTAGHVRRVLRAPGPLLELWPALGHLELGLLSLRRAPSAVVFHDPLPLTAARGYGRASQLLGSSRQRPLVITHSIAARDCLTGMGYKHVEAVPHPVVLASLVDRPALPIVRVIGQHKATRNLALLECLAPVLAGRGTALEIVGRGWPNLEGWQVRSSFLDEQMFEECIRSTSVLLLPYSHYWQSGVALRALACGVPVVGVHEGFLSEVVAAGPGLVHSDDSERPDAWAAAIENAFTVSPSEVQSAVVGYARRGADAATDLCARIVAQ